MSFLKSDFINNSIKFNVILISIFITSLTYAQTWGTDFQIVDIVSTMDSEIQKAYFYPTPSSEPQPLIVSMHTWSGSYSQWDEYAVLSKAKNLNYIHSDYRGPNKTFNACCSDLAMQDIDDAIAYAIANGNVDTSRIYVVGGSGGGYSTLGTFMRSSHNIKKFSAWVPITDLSAWYDESLLAGTTYATDVYNCTGSTGGTLNVTVAQQRSPLYWDTPTEKLSESNLYIYAGVHDGTFYDGKQREVPITHAINFYNKLLADLSVTDSSYYVTSTEKAQLLSTRLPLAEYGMMEDRTICLKKEYGNIKLIIFDGHHETLKKISLNEVLGDTLLSNINNIPTEGLNLTYVQAYMRVGAEVFTDRDFVVTSVPAGVDGLEFIQSANDDKVGGTITFDLNADADVIVAYDSRTNPPAWLSSFTDMGEQISTSDTSFNLYKKNFSKGNVSLGANDGGSMYLVIVEENSATNYTLSTSATNGSITLNPTGGTYSQGTIVTLTATANSGYEFSSWSGDLSGSTNPNILTMDANKTAQANFTAVPTYTVSVTATNGSVTLNPSGGTYNQGTVVTLTATANTGYEFSSWSGDLSGSTNPTTITMDADKNIQANFSSVSTYTLSTSAANGSIALNPSGGTYNEGTVVTLTANADAGYAFSSWSGNLSGATNPATITMDADKTVQADFALIPLSDWIEGFDLSDGTTSDNGSTAWSRNLNAGTASVQSGKFDVAATGIPGTTWTSEWININGGPVDIAMELSCAGADEAERNSYFEWNDSIQVYYTVYNGGTPVTTYIFKHGDYLWPDATVSATGITGDSIQINVYFVNSASNENWYLDSVRVTGLSSRYTIGTSITGDGSITLNPSGGTYDYGTVVTLTASANTGSEFSSWSGDLSGTSNPATLTIDGNKSVTASFDILQYTLSTSVTGDGSITLSPTGGTYSSGTVVTLTASPNTGSSFTSWSGDLSGSTNPTTLTMDGNKSVTATFDTLQYTLSTGVIGDGNIYVFPQGSIYNHGAVVSLYAVPNEGSEFAGWEGDLSGAFDATLIMDSHKDVWAVFYSTISTSVTGNGSITLNPPIGIYEYGTVVTLTATPDVGYEFSSWGGDLSGSNNPTTLTIYESKSVSATFDTLQYHLSTSVTGDGSITLNPSGGTYDYGTVVTLTASANTGSEFSSWSGDLSGSTNPTTLTMDGNKSVTASFDILQYTLSTSITGDGSITLNPTGGTYNYGTVVTLTASANTGSSFTSWSGDLSGSTNPTTLTMNANKSVSATFGTLQYTISTSVTGDGSISLNPTGGTYDYGTVVTLTASANTGSSFSSWSGDLSGSTNPTTLTMNANKSVSATFGTLQYTISTSVTGDGSISLNPTGGTYNYGAVVTLTANPGIGSVFTSWSGDLSGSSSPATLNMDANKSVTALFDYVTKVNDTKLSDVSVFPKYVSTDANVLFNLSQPAEVRIMLIDVLGRKVIDAGDILLNAGKHVKSIDLSGLNSGVYILIVELNNEVLTEKIIKK